MKWLVLVNQLLHGQQPNLTGVLHRQAVLLGHDIYIKLYLNVRRKFDSHN